MKDTPIVKLQYRDSEVEEMRPYGARRDTVGEGWYGLIAPIILAIRIHNDTDGNGHIALHQIKEKFGGLRFYTYGATDKIAEMILRAEEASYLTCEVCGCVGKLRNSSWSRTLCDLHYIKPEKKHVEET